MTTAICIHDFGGPDVLKVEDVPLPHADDGELLVRIHAASINPVDYKIRQGSYRKVPREKLPVVLGRDFSGTVENCGPHAGGLHKGDAVFGFIGWDRGTYAEYVAVKVGEFARKPLTIDHVHAAAVPLAGLTAWQGLFDHGHLQAGQRVLIHGGAGGVGHMAVQFAKAKGAWVATTVSQQDMVFVRELGADLAIDYKNSHFEDEVSDVDLVFDLIAGETQDRSFSVLKQGGAMVSTLQEPDAAKAYEKDIRGAHYMAEPNGDQLAEIARLIDAGKVKPVVQRTFPLQDAAQAQRILESEHVQGKLVLDAFSPEARKGASFKSAASLVNS